MNIFLRVFKKFYLLVFIFSVGFLTPKIVLAFGLSPATIALPNLPPHTTSTQTLALSRTNLEIEENYSATLSGPGAEFIRLSTSTVTFKPGERRISFDYFIVTEAKSTNNFEAEILFTPKIDSNNLKMVVLGGLKHKISFSVSNDLVALNPSNIQSNQGTVNQPGKGVNESNTTYNLEKDKRVLWQIIITITTLMLTAFIIYFKK